MPRSGGGGSHSSGSHSSRSFSHSSGGSRSFGGSRSGGYRSVSGGSRSFGSSSGGSRSFGGSHSGGYRPVSGGNRSFGSSSGGSRNHSRGFLSGAGPVLFGSGRSGKSSGCGCGLIFIIVIAVAMLFSDIGSLFSTSSQPQQVVHSANPGNPVIEDRIGALGSTSDLYASMTAFRDRTGVVPAIATLNDENWNSNYASLEAAAFDIYGILFQDEDHFLIVYSEPASPDPSFVDWSWECIVGDNTGSVLSDSRLDSFGTRLQRGLSDSQLSVNEAFTQAFDSITAEIGSTGSNRSTGSFLLPLVILIVAIVLLVRRSKKKNAAATEESATPVNNSAAPETTTPESTATAPESVTPESAVKPVVSPERACDYCLNILPEGAVKCPSCGAARKKE